MIYSIKNVRLRSPNKQQMLSNPSKYFEVDPRLIQYAEIFRSKEISPEDTNLVKVNEIFNEIRKSRYIILTLISHQSIQLLNKMSFFFFL